MTKKGPTLYKPASYKLRKLKQFAYGVRDKVNSFYGTERLELVDYKEVEDGDVLIAMLDSERGDDVLFIKWNDETCGVDDAVAAFIRGDLPDITEQFDAVEETVAWEDR